MARPREFDEMEAMDSAVEVFKAKGYEASSLMDLLKSMKLSKSSLYNSFGTKHELFLSAIDHYAINTEMKLKQRLEEGATAREKLQLILEDSLHYGMDKVLSRGCFLHNSALERLPHDELAAEKIASGLNRMRKVYIQVLEEGQKNGEISDRHSIETLADLFVNAVLGLHSFARVMPDEERLKKLSKTLLETII